ncbi:EamA family transporter [Zavarzinia compransoris]|nr:EamA family transporter [Zavarzinia compransoris]TDP47338.1 EamA-like transporter family protein [Zavarzinia compransoris]
MSWSVLFLILAAAALHAAWNTGVKAAGTPALATARLCLGGIVIAVVALPFLPLPAAAAWPFLAGSTVVHVVYFALTAAAYARVDLSIAYPMMRGGGVMVTTLVSPLVFADSLPALGLGGVAVVVLALAALAATAGRRAFGTRGLTVIAANALVIGAYSLLDGLGARASGAPLAYTIWVFALGAFGNLGLLALTEGRGFLAPLARPRDLGLGIAGACASVGSYGLVLTAMTLAPVALVAALRETSMLFATGFAAVLLHEKVGARRVAAACVVAAGAVMIKLA